MSFDSSLRPEIPNKEELRGDSAPPTLGHMATTGATVREMKAQEAAVQVKKIINTAKHIGERIGWLAGQNEAIRKSLYQNVSVSKPVTIESLQKRLEQLADMTQGIPEQIKTLRAQLPKEGADTAKALAMKTQIESLEVQLAELQEHQTKLSALLRNPTANVIFRARQDIIATLASDRPANKKADEIDATLLALDRIKSDLAGLKNEPLLSQTLQLLTGALETLKKEQESKELGFFSKLFGRKTGEDFTLNLGNKIDYSIAAAKKLQNDLCPPKDSLRTVAELPTASQTENSKAYLRKVQSESAPNPAAFFFSGKLTTPFVHYRVSEIARGVERTATQLLKVQSDMQRRMEEVARGVTKPGFEFSSLQEEIQAYRDAIGILQSELNKAQDDLGKRQTSKAKAEVLGFIARWEERVKDLHEKLVFLESMDEKTYQSFAQRDAAVTLLLQKAEDRPLEAGMYVFHAHESMKPPMSLDESRNTKGIGAYLPQRMLDLQTFVDNQSGTLLELRREEEKLFGALLAGEKDPAKVNQDLLRSLLAKEMARSVIYPTGQPKVQFNRLLALIPEEVLSQLCSTSLQFTRLYNAYMTSSDFKANKELYVAFNRALALPFAQVQRSATALMTPKTILSSLYGFARKMAATESEEKLPPYAMHEAFMALKALRMKADQMRQGQLQPLEQQMLDAFSKDIEAQEKQLKTFAKESAFATRFKEDRQEASPQKVAKALSHDMALAIYGDDIQAMDRVILMLKNEKVKDAVIVEMKKESSDLFEAFCAFAIHRTIIRDPDLGLRYILAFQKEIENLSASLPHSAQASMQISHLEELFTSYIAMVKEKVDPAIAPFVDRNTAGLESFYERFETLRDEKLGLTPQREALPLESNKAVRLEQALDQYSALVTKCKEMRDPEEAVKIFIEANELFEEIGKLLDRTSDKYKELASVHVELAKSLTLTEHKITIRDQLVNGELSPEATAERIAIILRKELAQALLLTGGDNNEPARHCRKILELLHANKELREQVLKELNAPGIWSQYVTEMIREAHIENDRNYMIPEIQGLIAESTPAIAEERLYTFFETCKKNLPAFIRDFATLQNLGFAEVHAELLRAADDRATIPPRYAKEQFQAASQLFDISLKKYAEIHAKAKEESDSQWRVPGMKTLLTGEMLSRRRPWEKDDRVNQFLAAKQALDQMKRADSALANAGKGVIREKEAQLEALVQDKFLVLSDSKFRLLTELKARKIPDLSDGRNRERLSLVLATLMAQALYLPAGAEKVTALEDAIGLFQLLSIPKYNAARNEILKNIPITLYSEFAAIFEKYTEDKLVTEAQALKTEIKLYLHQLERASNVHDRAKFALLAKGQWQLLQSMTSESKDKTGLVRSIVDEMSSVVSSALENTEELEVEMAKIVNDELAHWDTSKDFASVMWAIKGPLFVKLTAKDPSIRFALSKFFLEHSAVSEALQKIKQTVIEASQAQSYTVFSEKESKVRELFNEIDQQIKESWMDDKEFGKMLVGTVFEDLSAAKKQVRIAIITDLKQGQALAEAQTQVQALLTDMSGRNREEILFKRDQALTYVRECLQGLNFKGASFLPQELGLTNPLDIRATANRAILVTDKEKIDQIRENGPEALANLDYFCELGHEVLAEVFQQVIGTDEETRGENVKRLRQLIAGVQDSAKRLDLQRAFIDATNPIAQNIKPDKVPTLLGEMLFEVIKLEAVLRQYEGFVNQLPSNLREKLLQQYNLKEAQSKVGAFVASFVQAMPEAIRADLLRRKESMQRDPKLLIAGALDAKEAFMTIFKANLEQASLLSHVSPQVLQEMRAGFLAIYQSLQSEQNVQEIQQAVSEERLRDFRGLFIAKTYDQTYSHSLAVDAFAKGGISAVIVQICSKIPLIMKDLLPHYSEAEGRQRLASLLLEFETMAENLQRTT